MTIYTAGFGKLRLGMLLMFSLCISCSPYKNINTAFDKAPEFSKGFSGLAVYDIESQKLIFEKNSDKYFTPASNIKLLTFYAGLKTLKDSVAGLVYSVKNDSLIIWGTGDPSFLHPDLPGSSVFKFLSEANHKIYYHPNRVEEKNFGPGWAWDDYNYSYAAERSAFPIYGNLVSFKYDVHRDTLMTQPSIFSDSIKTYVASDIKEVLVNRNIDKNHFRYPIALNNKSFSQKVPFKTSSQLLVHMLSDTLGKKVELIKDLSLENSDKTVIYSISTDSLYQKMLQESDNFIAEQVLLLSSFEKFEKFDTSEIIKFIKEEYLNDMPDEVVWIDGSGLSRYNLVTPRSMVALLLKIHSSTPQERLFKLLPAGGESGNLKHSYKAEKPYIFAKTGTLRNNHSLSGYIMAKSGKVLIFSFMNSNYTVPTSAIKAQMEIILQRIYETH